MFCIKIPTILTQGASEVASNLSYYLKDLRFKIFPKIACISNKFFTLVNRNIK